MSMLTDVVIYDTRPTTIQAMVRQIRKRRTLDLSPQHREIPDNVLTEIVFNSGDYYDLPTIPVKGHGKHLPLSDEELAAYDPTPGTGKHRQFVIPTSLFELVNG